MWKRQPLLRWEGEALPRATDREPESATAEYSCLVLHSSKVERLRARGTADQAFLRDDTWDRLACVP